MKILGEKVRYYRKTKGLSQKELADGICTQATISLIEKKNKVPSMQILMKLCARLDIRPEDIIVENEGKLHRLLKELEIAIRDHSYDEAIKISKGIKERDLKENEDLKRFYYFQGVIQLSALDNPDEAIFYFGRTLNQYVTTQRDIYGVLATLGTGLAYGGKGTLDKAKVYVDEALLVLDDMQFLTENYLEAQIDIFLSAATLYLELKEYDRTVELTERAIRADVKKLSMFELDQLYLTLARAQAKLGKREVSIVSFQIANAISTVVENNTLLNVIKSEMESM